MGRKFNFFKDIVSPIESIGNRAVKSLAPVAKPLVGALTQKALSGIQSMKKGGVVKPEAGKKTQLIKLHQNEMVIPKKFVKHVPKSLKDKIKKDGGHNM